VVAPPASAATPARGQVSTFDYVVQQGDTIATIAARLGSSVDDILRANSISDPELIRPDQTLQIPMRQVPAEVMESSGTGSDGEITYSAPQITAPATGAVIARDQPVLLRWVSVDLLKENEWYVVLLYPQTPAARQFPSVWTKATSHRIELEYAPEEGQSAEYAWQVSVVRVLGGAGGNYSLEPASPSSELRRFIWQ
jgi:LysM repeat protein